MQAKPLAITIIILAILALAADTWLGRSTSASVIVEQGQLVPVPSKPAPQQSGSLDEVQKFTPFIPAEDSLETTRTVTQNLKDLTLVANLEKKLFRIRELSATDLQVASKNGIVVLSGSVSSEKEQQRVLGVARRVSGVKSVTNKIEIWPKKLTTSESSSG